MSCAVHMRSIADRSGAHLSRIWGRRVWSRVSSGVAAVALLLGAGPALAVEPRSTTPRVIGGEPTTGAAHPYLVSVGSSYSVNAPWVERHMCGGALISDRHILTAAHCVAAYRTSWGGNPARVAVARPDSSGELSSARVETGVRRISIHPQYDWQTARFDAAIIELESPLAGVVPLQPAAPSDRGLEAAGIDAVAPGWGVTEEGGAIWNTLMQAHLAVIDPTQCASNQSHSFLGTYFGGLGDAVDTASMLCAMGYRDGVVIDTCQGDSGGPLVAGAGPQARLIGITSWGRGCAIRWPGVYTRVSAVHDWIVDQMHTTDLEALLDHVKVEAIEARRHKPWKSTLSARVNAPVTLTFPHFGFPRTCEITPERSVCEFLSLRGKRLSIAVTVWIDDYTAVVISRTSVPILSKAK